MTIELKTEMGFKERRAELWKKGEEIIQNSPQLIIEVDVEADGIAGYGSMVAIGAQSAMGESYYSEVKPNSSDFIPGNREFCEAHGLERKRLLANAPDIKTVMPEFNEWIQELVGKHGKPPVFSAFNAGFDWAHVDLSFNQTGIKNPFGIAPLDLKSLAILLTDNWNWKETSKDSLPRIILPDGEFTHNALEDAKYQQKIHFGMAALLNTRGQIEIPEA